jgi:hypothetical protein
VTAPSIAQLRAHEKRIAGMLADPECIGELLLVGTGMARTLDLGDPPWGDEGHMQIRVIAERIYGRHRLHQPILGASHYSDRGDTRPRRRILDVFYADRRRYSADVDGDRGFGFVTCGRPMLRRDGLCGRNASYELQRRLTDPATGQRRTVGACSQPKCRAWFADLLDRNAAELKAHPAPVPPANTGGVLERHLPELDWWKIWAHVDKTWVPPPEGERFHRPTLKLVMTDPDEVPVSAPIPRPALVVHEGGWR